MLKIILNKEKRRCIYEIAFVMYLAELILFNSMYGKMEQLGKLFVLVRLTAYLLVCSKLLLDFLARTYTLKEISVIGVISTFLLWVSLHTGNKAILIYWAFIVGAHDVEYGKLIKWSCIVHVLCLGFVIGSSYAGILENRIYQPGGRERQSLGFQFTTESSNYFFYTILMWIYWRKEKITWKELGGLFFFAVFLFYATDTKNAFGLSCIALALSALLKKSQWLREYHKSYTILGVGCVPFLSYSIFQLSVRYSPRIPWMSSFNKLISGRLMLGKSGYEKYGVPLWGQRIEWIGGTAGYEGINKAYNYVDSSFMQILLNLGLVFLLLLVVLFMILGVKTAIKKDTYLFAVICILAVHSTFDPQIIYMEFDTFIMLYSYFCWKGESSVYLGRLKRDMVRHRGVAGFCLALFAVVFGMASIRKTEELEIRQALQQQKNTNYETGLLQYDSQIEDITQAAALAERQVDKFQNYIDSSVSMKLNGEAFYGASVAYRIDTENNLGNILNTLLFYINGGGLQSAVESNYTESDIKYWQEMVSCGTNENILSIAVTHYDEQKAQELLGIIKRKLEQQAAAIQTIQGTFIMTETETTVIPKTDEGVTANQTNQRANLENYTNALNDLKNRVTGLEDSKTNYMENGQPGEVKPAPAKVLLMLQYGAIGMLIGALLMSVVFMVVYLMCEPVPQGEICHRDCKV